MNYAVIMAGGTGKRLWPLSRQKRPKQVLKLLDGQTLLRRCFDRLLGIFDSRNVIVLTNADYVDVVREDLSELPSGNVIAEPAVRDTAGAIGLGATVLHKYDAEATMAVVTADQLIEPPEVLQEAIKDALACVNDNPDYLVTFGIQPSCASTRLGYVKFGSDSGCCVSGNTIYSVEGFKEKPDEATAKEYIRSGRYLWNSGMFVWKAKTILSGLSKFLPESTEPLGEIERGWDGPNQRRILEQWFPKLPKISIDYAVMEKAEKVFVIKLKCRWLDLGSFAALADIIKSDQDNNIVVADSSELFDCKNSIVVTEDKGHLIAVLGLENVVVAHSPDATLVCHVDQTDKLKELLEQIKRHGGAKFL